MKDAKDVKDVKDVKTMSMNTLHLKVEGVRGGVDGCRVSAMD
ncbi:Uncharacterised protein [Serratia marcescens]|nr:Uncharacterised protein [Serratia marcescens]